VEVVELGDESGQVTDTVVVGVEESSDEYLIDHRVAIPVGI
jgi:hypothetical protein